MQDLNKAIRRIIIVEMVKDILSTLLGYLFLLAEMAGVSWVLWNFLFVKLITTLPQIPFYGMVVIALVDVAAIFLMTTLIKSIRGRFSNGS